MLNCYCQLSSSVIFSKYIVLANQNAKLIGPDKGFLVSRLVLTLKPWERGCRFLLQYRTTPHCTTGVPPSELLFNRVIKGKLPVINSKKIVNRHKVARDYEKTRQERNREYANQRRNTRKSDLQVGDYVLVRQEKKNKLTANFNHKPYKVIKKTGSEILAQSKDMVVL